LERASLLIEQTREEGRKIRCHINAGRTLHSFARGRPDDWKRLLARRRLVRREYLSLVTLPSVI
jgi:ribosomal protein L34E